MNLAVIKNVSSRFISTGMARISKHSPVILTAVGVVGVVSAGVMASRATLKLESTVDSITLDRAAINDRYEQGLVTQAEHKKEMTRAYLKGTGKIVRLYAPSVSLGIFSIACIAGGHGILTKRNVALTAAYKAVETSYNNYRGKVIEEFGEEKDYQIRREISSKTVDEVVEDEETGEKKVVHRATHDHSQYARFFDEYNPNWRGEDNNINLLFLKSVQNYANDELIARGHLFLNDVYRRLGFEDTPAGALVGWVIEPGEINEVDFGIFNPNSDAARDFVNGYEKSILLDFNVDGIIYDKI